MLSFVFSQAKLLSDCGVVVMPSVVIWLFCCPTGLLLASAAAAGVHYDLLPLPSLTQTSPTAPRREGISRCLLFFLGLLVDELMRLWHRKIRFLVSVAYSLVNI
jgi:hypothetical protein